ncbi:tigger transposable element-derived protein 7-like [Eriocheir sinensis]|uniref:tigger transposable element-derived protein 7-like n=1 Tax=Eriocheir sinensis TaxID=95602 RepID=UPI0021C629AD|nr:tigger transposable element-derived protein 7-like [Eriocheir sinensis]
MPKETGKRKKVVLTIQQKLEILDKLKAGQSGTYIAHEYGIGNSTVTDIKKTGPQLRQFTQKHLPAVFHHKNKDSGPRTMKLGKYQNLDEALFKWQQQHVSSGLPVRGVDLQSAAETLANDLGINDFKASTGWLVRFRKHHLLANKRVCGEITSAAIDVVEPFLNDFWKLVSDEGLLTHQLYNFDETGLFWRALPNNTQASIAIKDAPGRKLDKGRISVLFGANADGTHRVTPVVVGKARRPRVLKDCMDHLPVHYFSSAKAWFTSGIFKDVFHKIIVPSITKHQITELKTTPHNVKALILLDNAPAHPAKEDLVSRDGRIRCMFLPANTTSIIQPMDQGVIQAVKMRYRRHFMQEILCVTLTGEEGDTRAQRTIANLKRYNLKTAIYNLENAWKQVPPSTLANAWNPLLRGHEDMREVFEGFDREVREVKEGPG